MADLKQATERLTELPLDHPAKVLAEAGAWLESVESETSFTRKHRLQLVSMIDEAADRSLEELASIYVGARPGTAGRMHDWRTLLDYLERLSSAYACVGAEFDEMPGSDIQSRMPIVLSRAMRAITRSMKIGCMRYLPPPQASWEELVRCYRAAKAQDIAETLVTLYPTDAGQTCVLHEFTVGVMAAAAALQSLTPRQVELVYRITTAFRGGFTVTAGRDEAWRHYLIDLDQPGPPARIPEQIAPGDGRMFFSSENVIAQIRTTLDHARASDDPISGDPFGLEFGSSEKLWALEHLLRFWDDTPPARRYERKRTNTKIEIALGVPAVQRHLEQAVEEHKPEIGGLAMVEERDDRAAAPETLPMVGNADYWSLTDFSTRGIAARIARRPDGWLKVGSLFGFRLERSNKWCVAVVRQLRTDARNQTHVGAEVLAKAPVLVTLECRGSAQVAHSSGRSGALLCSQALMLPHEAGFNERASLFFSPGTYSLAQNLVLHEGKTSRRITLLDVAESVDGWYRVEFDWLD